MTDDKNFVLTDLMKNESQFSWTISSSLNFTPQIKEFKIGTCEVLWKLGIQTTQTHWSSPLNFGFYGENLGPHCGTLIYISGQPSPSAHPKIQVCSCRNLCIKYDVRDKQMKYHQIQLSYNTNQLTIYGTITVQNCDCFKKPNMNRILEENIYALQEDIYSSLKKKQFTDIVIKVDKTSFPVHKCILRARSPVFDKMLEHQMKENQGNCITVTDSNEKSMGHFLSFLYSGNLEDDSFPTVIGLYALADKYQVISLQKTCRRLLISKISESTVMEILNVSDLHTDEELKKSATEYISCHFSVIALSAEWSSLIDSNTRLASYVLQYITSRCSNNSK